MPTGDGAYRLEYLGPRGWWVGHRGIDLGDVEAYVRKVNARPDISARAIDKRTGEIIGEPRLEACEFCGVPHTGLEGSCLL